MSEGMNLKDARLWRQMSQADLAKALGVSPGRISHLETARRVPTQKTLLTIAKALNCIIEIHPDGDVRFCPIL